jgi:hypothetical protein
MSHLTLTSDATFASRTDGKPPSRMKGTAYSGGRVPGRNMVIDLATTSASVPAPLLAQHSSDSAVGRVTAANIGEVLSIEADLYSDIDDAARLIAEKASRGHPWQLSVGLYDFDVEDVAPDKKIKVNGREFDGPIAVLRRGTVREVSIVALGADPHTNTTFFSNGTQPMADTNDQVGRFAALTAERDTARTRVAELERTNTEQVAQLAALTTERDALTARVVALEGDVRRAAVEAMFKAVGWQFSAEAAAPYVALSADAFAALSKDIVARVKPARDLPAHLMQSMTPSGTDGAPQAGALLSVVKAAHGVK